MKRPKIYCYVIRSSDKYEHLTIGVRAESHAKGDPHHADSMFEITFQATKAGRDPYEWNRTNEPSEWYGMYIENLKLSSQSLNLLKKLNTRMGPEECLKALKATVFSASTKAGVVEGPDAVTAAENLLKSPYQQAQEQLHADPFERHDAA